MKLDLKKIEKFYNKDDYFGMLEYIKSYDLLNDCNFYLDFNKLQEELINLNVDKKKLFSKLVFTLKVSNGITKTVEKIGYESLPKVKERHNNQEKYTLTYKFRANNVLEPMDIYIGYDEIAKSDDFNEILISKTNPYYVILYGKSITYIIRDDNMFIEYERFDDILYDLTSKDSNLDEILEKEFNSLSFVYKD